MDECERRRLVGDAILLERAAGVLERRYPSDEQPGLWTERSELHISCETLTDSAGAFRREAESGA